jgi:hypothetical protein
MLFCIFQTVDMWQDLAPPMSDRKATSSPIHDLEATMLYEPQRDVKLDDHEQVREREREYFSDSDGKILMLCVQTPGSQQTFERAWERLAGKMALWMTQHNWTEFVHRAANRANYLMSSKDNTYREHSLNLLREAPNDIEDIPIQSGAVPAKMDGRLMKLEVQNAWFGRPIVLHTMDEDIVDRIVDLFNPTVKKAISRDMWTIMSPIIDAFRTLDATDEGWLDEVEFAKLGRVVMARLKDYPRLKMDEVQYSISVQLSWIEKN